MRDLRIIFMGTPDFAVGVLKYLVEEGRNIVGVITAPDRPAGRGRKMTPSAVKTYALSQNLPILQPTNLKDDRFLEELRTLGGNLQIIVAFRMLPQVVWAMPEYGTFNLHATLLPQYRGAAPINWAIINKEEKTGVTTFFIDEKIDTGAIILKSELTINKDETAGGLHDKLMELGSTAVSQTVSLIEAGEVTTTIQPDDDTFKEAPKLTSENTRIDWTLSCEDIDAFIRGLSPYPVAWTTLVNGEENLKMKIYSASKVIEPHQQPIGKIIITKKELKIPVENGYLYIKELQLPGKRKMEVLSLLNGYTFEESAKVV